MGRLPANIRYVAVDFERDALEAKLIESGYHPDVQAVVVWEGVIDYLTESAVQSTLAVLARLLAPSSLLIFTYTSILQNPPPCSRQRGFFHLWVIVIDIRCI
jgi:O-methyltransferase involved in polyketide biosynthesis